MKCQNKSMKQWCDGKDVKLVQLRTQAAGMYGTNLYDGEKLFMCAGCRKSHCGGFKIVKDET